MTIKTILWFTFGGTFSALYANKIRGFHFLRKPQVHVITTLLGFAIGYKLHLFEENYEDLLQEARKANPLSTFYPRESLLAYQAMVRRKQEQTVVSDVDNESFEISEEEENGDE